VAGREHLLGNNMAVHARAVRAIRPLFDPAIGHAGSLSMGGDEVFLTHRLAALGLQWYEPAAVAHHRIPEDRLDRDWLRRRFWQGGFGQARVDRRCGVREPALARRIITAARATRGAWALRRRNARRRELGPEEASAELSAFLWAGMHVEMLLGRFPRLTGWLAAHGCP
jgi:hypothetical protein